MRIAITSAVYYPMTNGVAVFAHNLAKGLAQSGHEVMVFCPSFTGKHHIEKKDGVTVVGLKSIRMPIYPDQINKVPESKKIFGKSLPKLFYRRGLWVSPAPYMEMYFALKKFHPEVIHSQTSDPIGVAAAHYAREHEVPFVTTGHNYPDQITGQMKGLGLMKKPIDAVLAAFMANYREKSDYVTMPTEMAIQDLMLKKKREFGVPIEALSNGVDLSEFHPGEASAKIYKKYSIPVDSPIVLYVGRVDPAKSVGAVLEAFSQVLEKVSDAKLVIVGDGIDLSHLKELARYLQIDESVKFLGKVLGEDLRELYKVGNVFATASETETQGIVLIEAAATGLPIVAVDAGAVREICKTHENGFLCKPGNVDEIAKSIVKILQDAELQKKYGEASVKLAQNHDLKSTLTRFVEIYQEAIELKTRE